MTEMFGEAWSPMSVPDLAPDDDDQPQASQLGPFIRFLYERTVMRKAVLGMRVLPLLHKGVIQC